MVPRSCSTAAVSAPATTTATANDGSIWRHYSTTTGLLAFSYDLRLGVLSFISFFFFFASFFCLCYLNFEEHDEYDGL